MFADFRFVDSLVQMLDRLDPVAVEIMRRGFQMMFGIAHRFERFRDVRMLLRCGRGSRGGGKRSHCRNRRRRRFRSGCRRREGQRKEKCCEDQQSQ